ncbi:hypothetical protein UFOVP209_3 [uncultured Caudovirales phage]|uniref:Uncharacterized protein n=1 Tax=uncultured Caudovirales phage TaxID=2100421 RepID=A0A6J7WM16_9CAUD|nr:hypothetical protein UFOVP209_3 [uncultured Caudovirales phage]
MNADETKRCAKCWRYLPLSEFGHDGRTRDNLTYRCNDCRTIVPIDDTNSSKDATEPADRNDRAETITTTPHQHGEH